MSAKPKLLHSGAIKLNPAGWPLSHKALATFAADSITDFAPATGPGNHQRPLRALKRAGDRARQLSHLLGQARNFRRRRVNLMSNGEAQPRYVVGRRPVGSGGDVIQTRGSRRRDEERALSILHRFAHRIVHP